MVPQGLWYRDFRVTTYLSHRRQNSESLSDQWGFRKYSFLSKLVTGQSRGHHDFFPTTSGNNNYAIHWILENVFLSMLGLLQVRQASLVNTNGLKNASYLVATAFFASHQLPASTTAAFWWRLSSRKAGKVLFCLCFCLWQCSNFFKAETFSGTKNTK